MRVPTDLAPDVENAAARFGVKPRTLLRAALRLGLEQLTFEDLESPEDAERRRLRAEATELLEQL